MTSDPGRQPQIMASRGQTPLMMKGNEKTIDGKLKLCNIEHSRWRLKKNWDFEHSRWILEKQARKLVRPTAIILVDSSLFQVIWVDLSWLELTWVDLSWPELTWVDLSWLELNWVELSSLKLTWVYLKLKYYHHHCHHHTNHDMLTKSNVSLAVGKS